MRPFGNKRAQQLVGADVLACAAAGLAHRGLRHRRQSVEKTAGLDGTPVVVNGVMRASVT